jgi:alpha-tubulin suppressor-like RCC1 family protein
MPTFYNYTEGGRVYSFDDVFVPADAFREGNLWTWGLNDYGQLGTNNTDNKCTPVTTIAGGANWKQVASGFSHISAIKTDGTLWSWGNGVSGKLGDGLESTSYSPVQEYTASTNWKQVSCGAAHVAAIKTDGTLWTWGSNNAKQLGNNDGGYGFKSPTPITTFAGGTNWKQVTCGAYFTAAIKTDGTLWMWGYNYGRLGTNDDDTRCTPVTTFAGGTNWKQVACGYWGTAAIKTDGTLWTWGNQEFGLLGNNLITDVNIRTPVTTFAGGTNWKQVSCAYRSMAAIKTDGTLWTWGRNINGQLGVNTATTSFSINASVSGTVTATPPYSTLTTTNTQGLPLGAASYTVTTSPNNAELNGTYATFVAVANSTMYLQPLVTSSYTGTLTFSASGTTTTTIFYTPVTTFAGGTNWKQVDCGEESTSAIKTDGTLWTWGLNAYGRLGTNDTINRCTPVTTFAGGTNWKQVSISGFRFTAAVTYIDSYQ